MITEEELELALELRKNIKEIKADIAKIESVVLSSTGNISSGISMDGLHLKHNDYTKGKMQEFKEGMLAAYRLKLKHMEKQYKDIIEHPSDTLMRVLDEQQ